MSATPDPQPAPAPRVSAAGPESTTALHDLADALAVLGDDASRAIQHSRDVRLHVVACQAEHLAADVRTVIDADGGCDHDVPPPVGFTVSTRAARKAFEAAAPQSLPPTLEESLHWLLLLAEAAVP